MMKRLYTYDKLFQPRSNMNFRQTVQLSQLKAAFRLSGSKFNEIGNKIRNYEMPERIKGTFLERWAQYWHGLYKDYRDVIVDVAKDCKEHPMRTTIYTTILGACYYFNRHNPDETAFKHQLMKEAFKLMLLGELVRNPVSTQHVVSLEKCYNEGIIRRLNLGVLSLIWLDNYDRDCSLYKTTCSYLKPRYVTFYERIVDIGFLDKWWILEKKMENYDVNDAEFNAVVANNAYTVSAV